MIMTLSYLNRDLTRALIIFMLIALPKPDSSFTCTLFLGSEGEVSFSSLTNRTEVTAFFAENFSDALPLMENPIDDFLNKTASPLCFLNIDPCVINNTVALIDNSAHAMVPFYGQGMNCCFKDC
ncbi:MAG: kynurenine 3-monooxygenase [Colwellia sp.]|jgi:kynurenine 3-monooxygenase